MDQAHGMLSGDDNFVSFDGAISMTTKIKLIGVLIAFCTSSIPASAGFIINAPGSAVIEDFNSFRGTGFAPSPNAGQLDSDAWRVRGLSDGTGTFGGSHTTGDFARGASAGAVGTGGVYAFETSPGDFALGVQPGGTDFTPGSFELRIQNGTGLVLDSFSISYDTLVFNDELRSNSFLFGFSTDGTNFTDVLSSQVTSSAAAATVPSWVRTTFADSFAFSAPVAVGGSFILRWSGDDVAGSDSRDQFALDNVAVTATAVPDPSSLAFAAVGGLGILARYRRRRKANASLK